MKEYLKNNLWKEIKWLLIIIIGAALIELSIIYFLDINSILKIKIQGFIGLILLGYLIRLSARMIVIKQESSDPNKNEKEILE